MHMRCLSAVALFVLACSTSCASSRSSGAADVSVRSASSAEAVAVRSVLAAFDEAWNRHDIDALAALLVDEVQWVVTNGNCWRGKAQVWEACFTLHRMLALGSPVLTVRTGRVEVCMLGAEVAQGMATLMFGDGSNGSDQDGPGWHTRASFVMVRHGGAWKIAQFHQTMLDPRVEREDPIWGDAAKSQSSAATVGR